MYSPGELTHHRVSHLSAVVSTWPTTYTRGNDVRHHFSSAARRFDIDKRLSTVPVRVAIIQRQIPHYRVEFFSEVHTQAVCSGLEVTVYSAEAPDQHVRGDFRSVVLSTRCMAVGNSGFCWMKGLSKALRGSDVIVAPQELQCLNVPYMWAMRRTVCRSWIWWGHGYNHQRGSGSGLRAGMLEAVRRFMTRRGDGLITYTESGAKYWQQRGMEPERVLSYRNTIDVEGLRRAVEHVTKERLEDLRRKLGIEGRRVLLFAGRLYREKKVDFLLRSVAVLRGMNENVGLLILGDGPEREGLERLRARLNLDHVHFLGERIEPSETGLYFQIADLLAIPGLVGLAIVHGFAFGLPLATTAHEYHSPEIEYLSDQNGLMTPHDETEYARGIATALASPAVLCAMRQAAQARGDELLLADSVRRFVEGIRRFALNPSD